MAKLITFFLKKGEKPTEIDNLDIKTFWWKVPSVTKVLKETMSEQKRVALAEWRDKIGQEEAERIVAEAKERGKVFDANIEQYYSTGYCEQGYIRQYFEDKELTNLQMGFIYLFSKINIEGEVFPVGYKGFIDFEMKTENQSYITDTKTWSKHKVDTQGNPRFDWVDRDYLLQVSAYSTALGKDKAAILGSDGRSFQELFIYNTANFYNEFEKRLLHYIQVSKGVYFKQNDND